ncbi:MAG: CDP-alcohol phosphatidyltransferase family protein, partial [Clostridia bacterium]|nr:CDP-alcohol phosphatidyltransferase family protein [Clostridia bacterium]
MVGFYNYTVVLTYIGVASAVLGLGFCVGGRPSAAIVCLMASGFCDLFDGSVARTRQRSEQEKKFGIQIDSLADLICFGVLPVAIGYALGLRAWYEALILACYTLAALVRLAYYNVTEDELQINRRTQRVCYDGLAAHPLYLRLPAPVAGAVSPSVSGLDADHRRGLHTADQGAQARHEGHDRLGLS